MLKSYKSAVIENYRTVFYDITEDPKREDLYICRETWINEASNRKRKSTIYGKSNQVYIHGLINKIKETGFDL